jgi:DMSO/TMAO reductase YedYZ molybdopterin-dependent catalytic subunit
MNIEDFMEQKCSRRNLLRGAVLSGGAALCGLHRLPVPILLKRLATLATENGQKLGLVPFINEGSLEMDVATGAELEGRLYADLANLNTESLVTPTSRFYVRTRASSLLPDVESWNIRMDGMRKAVTLLPLPKLKTESRPMGIYLMECAGNQRVAHFGMISVANWSGVPIAAVLSELGILPDTKRILISGFDRYVAKSASSVPGASWIFTVEQLKTAGAFLATEMNDQPLTRDHGAPVRLVVPGWYGCTCIKWVDRISVVGDGAEATSQMQEYSGRTHQKGVPRLAREFAPARIDFAAMPVRIEKWGADGKLQYRVVGICWGGHRSASNLKIRFNPEEEFVPVSRYEPGDSRSWSFWEHDWSPKEPGVYNIRLTTEDSSVAARRLESGYYVRAVEISEV